MELVVAFTHSCTILAKITAIAFDLFSCAKQCENLFEVNIDVG